ncbi:MAG TPA: thioredoxin family protein [Smithellaceae bacterium]|nr:thioredoxin family protein [Smithellaceae bacterium]
MTEEAIKQVNIDNRLVAIKGLEDAIETVHQASSKQEVEKIADALVDAISKQNYVPASARPAHGRALLREYKIAMNLPVDEEPVVGMTVFVLGMGCARCDQLLSDLRDVLSEMQIAADLRHVTNPVDIARFGAKGMPALVINKSLVCAGVVPPKTSLRRWISEALGA